MNNHICLTLAVSIILNSVIHAKHSAQCLVHSKCSMNGIYYFILYEEDFWENLGELVFVDSFWGFIDGAGTQVRGM